jgi:hypothetical protein
MVTGEQFECLVLFSLWVAKVYNDKSQPITDAGDLVLKATEMLKLAVPVLMDPEMLACNLKRSQQKQLKRAIASCKQFGVGKLVGILRCFNDIARDIRRSGELERQIAFQLNKVPLTDDITKRLVNSACVFDTKTSLGAKDHW